MQKKMRTRRLMEQVQQDMKNLYREHRESVIHFNHDEKTARLFVDGKDEGVLIFGTLFDALKRLANNAKTCRVDKAFERMQAVTELI